VSRKVSHQWIEVESDEGRSYDAYLALPAWTHFYNWHGPHHGINLVPPISRLSVPRKNLLTLHA
jgi:hypothetical protein